jgi:DNA phosphorothioation-associated putative methyltransferase
MSPAVARHRTALQRHQLSRPIRLALEDGLITHSTSVFDYGCGHGNDHEALKQQGVASAGWDPNYFPNQQHEPSDVVNLGYVVNVIEDMEERASALRAAWSLTRKLLIVSARLTVEASQTKQLTPFGDGCLTRRETFQKFYDQRELREWINEVLAVSSTPAAPGIFYVFRDVSLQQSFTAQHYRRASAVPARRRSDLLFEQHKEVFESLMEFIAVRGRLPSNTEFPLPDSVEREFGSLKRAFKIIRRLTGSEKWDQIRDSRSQDLLVYLSLARFGGRPRFSKLSQDLQLDVRAFFVTYARACALADKLLFSAGNMALVDKACLSSSVGKLTPTALYLHTSARSYLPPLLRVYEGCARTYIGSVEAANIIKLHRRIPQVSYLAYPDFERDPHPSLYASLVVPLQTFRIRYLEYTDSPNPPILHRKEEFLQLDHPLKVKFAKFSRQEESYGLYEKTSSIGTRIGWQEVLESKRVRLIGHRVARTG